MDQNLLVIALLAAFAGVVLYQLYAVLGRRTGAERPPQPQPQPVQGELPREASPAPPTVPTAQGSVGEGLVAIIRADPSFEVDRFVAGSRGAYELIVNAFAKGDREALRDLLTPRVYESYASAITQREAQGGQGPELVRLKSAEVSEAELKDNKARVTVKFEAELAEGAHGVRDAHERWTFERDVRSGDPNWLLARVQAA